MRVLPVENIPEELWSSKKLSLPPELVTPYRNELVALGMLEKAEEGRPKSSGIHGGPSDEETIEHFVYRFSASSGRMEFVSIAPDDVAKDVSDAILSAFSKDEVSVLDIPGGAGAAMCSLLATILVLRRNRVVPTLPMTVRILSGELSPKANEIYRNMISSMEESMREYSISVQYESMIWDATRNDQTAILIDKWFSMSRAGSEYFLCISNFSGALMDAKLFDEFTPCLNQILARLHDKKSTVLWIEPNSTTAKKMIGKIEDYFMKAIKWFKKVGDKNSLSSTYSMVNPINGQEHSGGVEIQRFERV